MEKFYIERINLVDEGDVNFVTHDWEIMSYRAGWCIFYMCQIRI